MVRAAVAFLRGACPFLDDEPLWLADAGEEFFFLLVEDPLECFFLGADEESCAGIPLP